MEIFARTQKALVVTHHHCDGYAGRSINIGCQELGSGAIYLHPVLSA